MCDLVLTLRSRTLVHREWRRAADVLVCRERATAQALARGGRRVPADEDVGRPAPLVADEEFRRCSLQADEDVGRPHSRRTTNKEFCRLAPLAADEDASAKLLVGRERAAADILVRRE